MYFKTDKQISVFEFGQVAGITLDPENIWIKKAHLIDWDMLEEKYSYLFCENNGRGAKPIRLALATLIIKREEGFSDVGTILHIKENPYIQYFCGIKEYSHKEPFASSLMVEFRKRFNEEIMREINEIMVKPQEPIKNEDGDKDPPNSGTLILDATCTPADATYPKDIILCNKAREKTEEMVETMHTGNIGKVEKPRLDKQKARLEYLKTAKGKNRSKKVIRNKALRAIIYKTTD